MPEQHDTRNTVLAHLGSIVVSCCVLYFGYLQTLDTNDAEFVKTLVHERSQLIKENANLRESLAMTRVELAKMKSEYDLTINFLDVYTTGIQVMPFPVWVKRVEYDDAGLPVFRMVEINQQYTAEYGIRANEYRNKLDREVHPPALAEHYYTNDLAVYTLKRDIRTIEKVRVNGVVKEIIVFKYWFQTADGAEYIGGASISVIE